MPIILIQSSDFLYLSFKEKAKARSFYSFRYSLQHRQLSIHQSVLLNISQGKTSVYHAARECDIAIRERNPFDTSVRSVYKVHNYTFLGKNLSKAIPSTTIFQCCGNEVIHSVLGGILAFQSFTVHILLAFAKCQAEFPCEIAMAEEIRKEYFNNKKRYKCYHIANNEPCISSIGYCNSHS